jgi:colanic acid biosynthesis glycosyl transferase WcaI
VRPRILLLNQYYWPGVEATAHLLAELCEALAVDFEITVVTGRLQGRRDLPAREVRNGVEIIRVKSAANDRTQLARRGLNYITYLLRAFCSGIAQRKPDVVLCATDPPIIGDVALAVARKHRVPLIVISEDVFPEIAVALHRLENRQLVGLLRLLVRLYLRRADRVVAIGDTMKRRLEDKGARPECLRVIPNWTDVSAIRPQSKSNAWSIEQGLTKRFVVMHSGNVGHAQDIDTLIRASTLLRDLDDLRVVIIGTGARRAELVELQGVLEADKVEFLDFQPRERLPETLATADLHIVGLARGLAGYVVPSRLYSVLAAGRPVIAAAEDESETSQIVRGVRCGLVVPPGDPLRLAVAIRACRNGEWDLASMGRRAREYAEVHADRSVAVEGYRDLLDEVVRRDADRVSR